MCTEFRGSEIVRGRYFQWLKEPFQKLKPVLTRLLFNAGQVLQNAGSDSQSVPPVRFGSVFYIRKNQRFASADFNRMQVHEVFQHIGRGTESGISPLRHHICQMLKMHTSA